jgi:acetyl esterase
MQGFIDRCFLLICVLNLLAAEEGAVVDRALPSMSSAKNLRQEDLLNKMPDPFAKKRVDEWKALLDEATKRPLAEVRKEASLLFFSRSSRPDFVKQIEDIEILGEEQNRIPLRIYVPQGSAPLPPLVYFHSGGWVVGTLDDSDHLCRKMANIFGCIVISVEYRLAPEFPFPSAMSDCYAATRWVFDNIDSFGGDHHRLIVCGSGTGGNLAAAAALWSRDRHDGIVCAQVLLYPPVSAIHPEESSPQLPDQYFLTNDMMKSLWHMYLRFPGDAGNQYASLDAAPTLKGVAPAVIITAEYDSLHLEAEHYAALLRDAGVYVADKRFSGVCHGFFDLPIYDDDQKAAWLHEVRLLLKKIESRRDAQEN